MKSTRRENLNLNLTILDNCQTMAEGNPGALSVLAMLMGHKSGAVALLQLDAMNIRGAQIWVAFKDHCESDLNKLIDLVLRKDAALIDTVNNSMATEWLATSKDVSMGGRPLRVK